MTIFDLRNAIDEILKLDDENGNALVKCLVVDDDDSTNMTEMQFVSIYLAEHDTSGLELLMVASHDGSNEIIIDTDSTSFTKEDLDHNNHTLH